MDEDIAVRETSDEIRILSGPNNVQASSIHEGDPGSIPDLSRSAEETIAYAAESPAEPQLGARHHHLPESKATSRRSKKSFRSWLNGR